MIGIYPNVFYCVLAKCTGSPASRADPRLGKGHLSWEDSNDFCWEITIRVHDRHLSLSWKYTITRYYTAYFGICPPLTSSKQLFFLHRLSRRACCIMAITICLGRVGSCESEHWRSWAAVIRNAIVAIANQTQLSQLDRMPATNLPERWVFFSGAAFTRYKSWQTHLVSHIQAYPTWINLTAFK